MAKFFSSILQSVGLAPKMPAQVAAPQQFIPQEAMSPAAVDTPAVQAAAEAEKLRQRRARGRAATMLTEGGAETGPIGTTKLLGG